MSVVDIIITNIINNFIMGYHTTCSGEA